MDELWHPIFNNNNKIEHHSYKMVIETELRLTY